MSVDVGCSRSRHCLVTSENGIQLDPPVTQARLTLQAQVSRLVDAARQLPRLRASRFDALNNDDGDAYDDLLVEEDNSSKTLTKALDAALAAIERRVTDALARETLGAPFGIVAPHRKRRRASLGREAPGARQGLHL